MANLHPDHLADLRKSGLSDETIEAAGFYSVCPRDIRKITANPKITSLLALPYPGEDDFSRFKVWPPDLKGTDGKGQRYIQPKGSGVHVYCPPAVLPILDDPTAEVWITEGEKKSAKSTQEGVPCVGLGGLWNWLEAGRLLPRLECLARPGRSIVLCPDSDVWKPKRQDLRLAVYRLGRALEARGARVSVCVLPNGPGDTKQGLDDYLCAHTADELRALPRIPLTAKAFRDAQQRERARENLGRHDSPKANPHSAPQAHKVRHLLAKTFPEPRAVVPGVLLEGAMMLVGKPKLGKSRLALALAVAVAQGGKALGQIPVEPGQALVISLEDPERRLQKRLRAMLVDAEAPDTLEYATSWPRLDQGGVQALAAWIDAHPQARLIVIDTWKRIKPRDNPRRSTYDEDYEGLQPLQDLANKHPGLAILIVHHANKLRDVEDVSDLISGSTGLSGSVDGFAVLRRQRGAADAVLSVVHRDLEEDQELALQNDCENQASGGWVLLGDASDFRLSQERREVLTVLRESTTPLTPKRLAEALGKDDAKGRVNVRMLLSKMAMAGEVRSVGDGHYTIPVTSVTGVTSVTPVTPVTPPPGEMEGVVIPFTLPPHQHAPVTGQGETGYTPVTGLSP